MRVLVVIDSLGRGGAETATADLAAPLIARGVEYHVAYFTDRDGVGPRIVEAGGRLHPLTGATSRIARIRAVRSLIRQVHPDVVHTVLYEADIAGRSAAALTRTPCVSSIVNDSYGPEHRAAHGPLKVRAAQALDAVTARACTRFHALTQHVAHTAVRRLRLPRRRIHIVPRGKDHAGLGGARTDDRRRRVRAALGWRDTDTVVLCVGRQEPQKDLVTAVRAFDQLAATDDRVLLVLAGRTGADTPRVAAAIAGCSAPDRVVQLGQRDDVADVMTAADVLLFPSLREGLGLTLVEASALELPIVTSDLPVLREVLGGPGECALLARPGDPAGFAAAVRHCLDDTVATQQRVARALQRFTERYELQTVADQMMALYRDAVA